MAAWAGRAAGARPDQAAARAPAGRGGPARERGALPYLAEVAEDAIFIVNADGTFQYVNQAAARFVGVPPTELVGRPRDDVFPRLLYNHQEQNIRSVFATGQTRYDEYPIATPTGELWFHTALAPIVDAQWHVHGVLGIARAISPSASAEHELLNLREAVSAARGYVSHRRRRHDHMDQSGLLPAVWLQRQRSGRQGHAAHSEERACTARGVYCLWQTILRKRIVQDEIVNRTKDQRFVTVDRSVSPVLDSDGAIIGFLTIQRDVTARKQAERLQSAQFANGAGSGCVTRHGCGAGQGAGRAGGELTARRRALGAERADQRLRGRYGWYAPAGRSRVCRRAGHPA